MALNIRPPLSAQVIVITGASSGIGLATARRAAAAGASVLLVARGEAALAKIVAEIAAAGGIADYAVADVGVPDQVQAAADKAIARFGRIDSWVNNAGTAIYAKLEQTPFAEHERMFRTNYFGVVNGALAALPHLRKTQGGLITVGSIASEVPSPILGAYSASKHATKAFVDSLRIELIAAGDPVWLTLVKPSGIDTPIGQHAANHTGEEALIPPPVYDVAIVADAILHVLEHPRREITIGGLGRVNVLLGQHFPRMLDHLARFMIPLLTNPAKRPTPTDNLFAAGDGGRARSGVERGRGFSFYTSIEKHRFATGLGFLASAGFGAAVLLARGKAPSKRSFRTKNSSDRNGVRRP